MRGKETFVAEEAAVVRITPAYAGKSVAVRLLDAIVWDHPRVCGEKLQNLLALKSENRITPAYAGKRAR